MKSMMPPNFWRRHARSFKAYKTSHPRGSLTLKLPYRRPDGSVGMALVLPALTDCRWWIESLLVQSGVSRCDPPKGNGRRPQKKDLEAAIRQLRQIGCILDSCTISASYEVTQAQKAILLLDHTAKGASTSSEELNAQISPRTDDEHNLPYHEDNLQEH